MNGSQNLALEFAANTLCECDSQRYGSLDPAARVIQSVLRSLRIILSVGLILSYFRGFRLMPDGRGIWLVWKMTRNNNSEQVYCPDFLEIALPSDLYYKDKRVLE